MTKSRSSWKMCVQLLPPSPARNEWRLRICVQNQNDPAQVATVVEFCRSHRGLDRVRAMARRLELRNKLGEIFAPHNQLPDWHDDEMRVDMTCVVLFLRSLKKIRSKKFGVIIPPSLLRFAGRKTLKASLATDSRDWMTPQGLDLESLRKISWTVTAGDVTLDAANLAAAVNDEPHGPLIKIGDEWQIIDEAEMSRILDFITQTGSEVHGSTLVRGMLDPFPSKDFDVQITAPDDLRKALNSIAEGQVSGAFSTPSGFCGQLHPFQERGAAWLTLMRRLGLGALLADEMGLGKTIQTLAALVASNAASTVKGLPSLIVCPVSVLENWKREAQKFAPSLKVWICHGPGRSELPPEGLDCVLTSYATIWRTQALLGQQWDAVILDEAQNVKNHLTHAAKAIRKLECRWRLALTGTPMENHVGELWSIHNWLNPWLLGTRENFKKQFAEGVKVGDAATIRRLRALTGAFTLRRLKLEVAPQLPAKIITREYCPLTQAQKRLYQQAVDESMGAIATGAGIARRGRVLALLTRLKQVCNFATAPFGALPDSRDSGKIARLTELLQEIRETGEKVLLFTQYMKTGEVLKNECMAELQRPVDFLHGGVDSRGRKWMVESFQGETCHNPPAMVISLRAGGAGLNLTAASHVIHFDRWWNPAVEDQATDRAHRIGQTLPVQVHLFISPGTLEEKIDAMLENKRKVFSSVVGESEQWITELSTKELEKLFRLEV